MSIDLPSAEISENDKRRVGYDLDFYVDNRYSEDFDEQPAWNLINHVAMTRRDYSNSR